MERTKEESNNYKKFLNKTIKVILCFPNGQVIVYQGELLQVDDDSLFLKDRYSGYLIVRIKDISQILEVKA